MLPALLMGEVASPSSPLSPSPRPEASLKVRLFVRLLVRLTERRGHSDMLHKSPSALSSGMFTVSLGNVQ